MHVCIFFKGDFIDAEFIEDVVSVLLLKITDFGLARAIEESKDYAGSVCGTRVYMAPEAHKGNNHTNKSTLSNKNPFIVFISILFFVQASINCRATFGRWDAFFMTLLCWIDCSLKPMLSLKVKSNHCLKSRIKEKIGENWTKFITPWWTAIFLSNAQLVNTLSSPAPSTLFVTKRYSTKNTQTQNISAIMQQFFFLPQFGILFFC